MGRARRRHGQAVAADAAAMRGGWPLRGGEELAGQVCVDDGPPVEHRRLCRLRHVWIRHARAAASGQGSGLRQLLVLGLLWAAPVLHTRSTPLAHRARVSLLVDESVHVGGAKLLAAGGGHKSDLRGRCHVDHHVSIVWAQSLICGTASAVKDGAVRCACAWRWGSGGADLDLCPAASACQRPARGNPP